MKKGDGGKKKKRGKRKEKKKRKPARERKKEKIEKKKSKNLNSSHPLLYTGKKDNWPTVHPESHIAWAS